MSAFFTSAFVEGRRDAEKHSQQKRLVNATAWNAYLEDAKKSGREVTPQELDRYRTHLTGGDSFFMGHLPSKMMLDDITQQNNRQAEQQRIADLSQQVEKQTQITEAARGMAGFEDPPDVVLNNLVKQYGQEGETMYKQIEPRLQDLQNQNVKERASSLFDSTQGHNIVRPEDVQTFFGRESQPVQRELMQMAESRYREHRNKQVAAAVNAVNQFREPSYFMNMKPEHQEEFARAQLVAAGNNDPTSEEIARVRAPIAVMSSTSMADRLQQKDDKFGENLAKEVLEMVSRGERVSPQQILGMANAMRLEQRLPPLTMEQLEQTVGGSVVRWVEHQTYENEWNSNMENARSRGVEIAAQQADQYNVRLNEASQHLIINKPDGASRMANHDPAHNALLSLIQEEVILRGSPTMHARRAAELHHSGELRNREGVTTPEAIAAQLVEEFGGRTRQELAMESSAELMSLMGFGLDPGTSVDQFGEEQMEAFLELERDMLKKVNDPDFDETLGRLTLRLHENIDLMEKMLQDRQQIVAFREYVGNDRLRGEDGSEMGWETRLADTIWGMREWAEGFERRLWNQRENAMSVLPQEGPLPSTGQPIFGGRVRLSDGPDQAAETDEYLQGLRAELATIDPRSGVARYEGGQYIQGNRRYHELQREIREVETRIRNEAFRNRGTTGRGGGARSPSQPFSTPPAPDAEDPEPVSSQTPVVTPEALAHSRPRPSSPIRTASASDTPLQEVFLSSANSDPLVVAAADTAFWFESRNGTVPDRPNSQFVGPYQIGSAKREELGLSRQDARDPQKARAAYEKWVDERAIPALARAGIEPTPANIYLTWQQGVAGFRQIHDMANRNQAASPARQRNMDENPPPGSTRRTGLSPKEWLQGWQDAIERRSA